MDRARNKTTDVSFLEQRRASRRPRRLPLLRTNSQRYESASPLGVAQRVVGHRDAPRRAPPRAVKLDPRSPGTQAWRGQPHAQTCGRWQHEQ